MSQPSWTLLLTASSRRCPITVDPDTTTTRQIYQQAQELFAADSVAIRRAFPPQVLVDNDETIRQAGLQPQDRLVVEIVTADDSAKSKKPKRKAKKKADKNDDNDDAPTAGASNTRRSQRASAARATASFSETIRQQDELMAAAGASRKRSSSQRSSASTRSSRPRFPTNAPGRRLQDGAVIQSPRRRRQQPAAPQDPALQLIGAVSGRDQGSRLMRQGWRQAVQDAVEQNKAVARLAAIQSGQYSFALQNNRLTVTFAKGVQGRGHFEDTVDQVDLSVLTAVVAAIHASHAEALRPTNLALLSPRVLWSLVYHHRDETAPNQDETAANENQQATPVDVGVALQQLHPDLDWSFLRRRRQQLSAKARENLRQQQIQDQQVDDWEAAAQAIESVEQAMGDLQAMERQHLQTRTAQAASQRVQYVVITPDDTDVGELQEVIRTSSNNDKTDSQIQRLAQALLQDCGIHNARELANCEAQDLAQKLGEPVDTIQAWINEAQLISLEEIMVDICQNEKQAVDLLSNSASSGTPQDLAAWCGMEDLLWQELLQTPTNNITQQQLVTWCDRARQALEQLEWLNLYAMPVE